MILDNIKNAELYQKNDAWKKALDFLASVNQNTPDGEYEIDGRQLYAVVVSYKSKSYAEGVLESHKKYVDVQYVFSGREKIYISRASKCELLEDYDESKDVIFYQKDVSHDFTLKLEAGDFCFIFPHEAHSPSIRAGGVSEDVKKVVIKMAVELA